MHKQISSIEQGIYRIRVLAANAESMGRHGPTFMKQEIMRWRLNGTCTDDEAQVLIQELGLAGA